MMKITTLKSLNKHPSFVKLQRLGKLTDQNLKNSFLLCRLIMKRRKGRRKFEKASQRNEFNDLKH